ncbi:MAG: hypothetical protein QOG63_370 [Thermoleophilaceae bacterium]|jgi:hypothetical protein|nr:hypothetical protein [Thermoleophilaceae bacterium]
MQTMHTATVIQLSSARERGRRVSRAMDARRRLRDRSDRRDGGRPAGRAWVNGSELGGRRNAYAHLAESYD